MTRLFLDTNIVVDLLGRREPFCNDAVRLFSMAYNKQVLREVVKFFSASVIQYFNFKIFHFVVKDIPVQIWYKLPDISSGTSSSPKMKMCDTTLSIVPHSCLVFLRQPDWKAIKNGCRKLSSTRFNLIIISQLLNLFIVGVFDGVVA
ncbi:MAG: hypothetical protein J5848_06190 [Bacteroidales bacterium]|nr:hypothetical protein [Bacteroidales bacterium]